MNQKPFNQPSPARASLDARLTNNPELAEALHKLLDEMDQSPDLSAMADDVEDRVRERVRKVGLETLRGWAERAEAKTSGQVRGQNPGAVRHSKKNSGGKPSSDPSTSRSKSGG